MLIGDEKSYISYNTLSKIYEEFKMDLFTINNEFTNIVLLSI